MIQQEVFGETMRIISKELKVKPPATGYLWEFFSQVIRGELGPFWYEEPENKTKAIEIVKRHVKIFKKNPDILRSLLMRWVSFL